MGALGSQIPDDREEEEVEDSENDAGYHELANEELEERTRRQQIAEIHKAMRRAIKMLAIGFAKYLLENSFQLWLQASLFAIIFSFTTTNGKTKMMISMALGVASLLYKFLEGTLEFYRARQEQSQDFESTTRLQAALFAIFPLFC